MAAAPDVAGRVSIDEINAEDFVQGLNVFDFNTEKELLKGNKNDLDMKVVWDSVNLQDSDVEEWKQIVSDSNVLQLLIVGKTAAGKSTLINGLIGKNVAEEGVGVSVVGTTKVVSSYSGKFSGVEVEIFDSPGLQDGTMNDEGYLKEMKTKCRKVDLVMFALRMTDSKFVPGNPDSIAMKNLTKAFGPSVWQKTIILLTCANAVEAMNPQMASMDARGKARFFKKMVADFTNVIRIKLRELKVPEFIVMNVKVIPTGHELYKTLPDGTFWFSSFWHQTVAAIPNANAKLAMIRINSQRFRLEKNVEEDQFIRDLSEQPIIIQRKSSDIKKTSVTVAGVMGGGAIGAAVGAICLIGGPIGVIGIPIGLYVGMMAGAILAASRKSEIKSPSV